MSSRVRSLRQPEVPVPDRIDAGIDRARHRIAASGSRWTGRQRVELVALAAGAPGNFEMMNRVVDAVGLPLSVALRSMAGDLGLTG